MYTDTFTVLHWYLVEVKAIWWLCFTPQICILSSSCFWPLSFAHTHTHTHTCVCLDVDTSCAHTNDDCWQKPDSGVGSTSYALTHTLSPVQKAQLQHIHQQNQAHKAAQQAAAAAAPPNMSVRVLWFADRIRMSSV